MDALLTVGDGVQSRDLGEQERLIHEMHRFGGLICSNVMHIRGPLEPERVRQALTLLQRKYALLRAHIRYGKWALKKLPPYLVLAPSFHLEGTTEIPLAVMPGADWWQVLQKELRTPIRTRRGPRMRAIFIPAGDDGISHLITTTDHTISDAQAGMALSASLLEFIADPDQEVHGPAGLPPALETYLPPKSNSGKKAYEPAIRLPNKWNWRVPRETRGITREFTREETAAINAAVKKNRATIHGTVTAALLDGIGRQYDLPAMTCVSTIELRRMCRPALPADTFGCFIDIFRTRHELRVPFWDLARDVAQKLVATIARDQETASILKMPDGNVYRHEIWKSIKSGFRVDGMGMTTAGKFSMKKEFGEFVLEDSTMLISMHTIAPGFFGVNFEIDGKLSFGMMYFSQTLTDEDATSIAEKAAERLRSLAA